MKRLYYLILTLAMGAISVNTATLAQNTPIPVDSVESPQLPTGNSEDIQGIERDANNWDWGIGGNYPQKNEEATSKTPYILSPDNRSPQELTDEFRWQNIGEPTSEGAKIPLKF